MSCDIGKMGNSCGEKYKCDIVNRKEHKADILLMEVKE